MTTVDYIFIFSTALFFFLVIDLVWLGYVARDFYRKHLKRKLLDKPKWGAAISFYMLFILGLMYFAIVPAINDGDFIQGVFDASMYGIFTYVTYQLTNYATLKAWPRELIAVDILWGIVLSSTVTALTYIVFFII